MTNLNELRTRLIDSHAESVYDTWPAPVMSVREILALIELADAARVLVTGWHDYARLVDNGDTQAVRVEEALSAVFDG